MTTGIRFVCPACGAKLKSSRLPRKPVTCPQCRHPFEPTLIEIEPASAEETYALQDPGVVASSALQNAIVSSAPSTSPQATESPPLPLPLPLPPAQSQSQTQPSKRTRADKQNAATDYHVWLYRGGVTLLVIFFGLFTFVAYHFGSPGKPPTLDEIAGEYASRGNPNKKIRLTADGNCMLIETSGGGSSSFGLQFVLEHRTINLVLPKEIAEKPTIGIDKVSLQLRPNFWKLLVAEYGDLTFKDGSLFSSTLGRFVRVDGPPEKAADGDGVAKARAADR